MDSKPNNQKHKKIPTVSSININDSKIKEGAFSRVFWKEVKIYTLSDSNDNVFYVGCTTNSLKYRFSAHITDAQTYKSWPKNRRSAKINKIIELGFHFKITIIDIRHFATGILYSASNKIREYEKGYINKYLEAGCALTNREAKKFGKPQHDFVGKTITTKAA